MSTNFVPHPGLPGEGRCRICDMGYSKLRGNEVAEHRRYHKLYLKACDGVGAPVPERTREAWRRNGLALQNDTATPFKERLAAAERWLVAEHHEHLVDVLRYGVRRLDLCEFFTKNVEGRGRLSNFAPDVAAELRLRYSDNFIG